MGVRAQYGKVLRANGNFEWCEPQNGFRFSLLELQAIVHGRVSQFDLRSDAPVPMHTTGYWCQEAEERGDPPNEQATFLARSKPVFGDVVLVTGEPLPVVEFVTENGPVDQREDYAAPVVADVLSQDASQDSPIEKLARRVRVDETIIRDELRRESTEAETGLAEAMADGECGEV
jgi:hypothetical protein